MMMLLASNNAREKRKQVTSKLPPKSIGVLCKSSSDFGRAVEIFGAQSSGAGAGAGVGAGRAGAGAGARGRAGAGSGSHRSARFGIPAQRFTPALHNVEAYLRGIGSDDDEDDDYDSDDMELDLDAVARAEAFMRRFDIPHRQHSNTQVIPSDAPTPDASGYQVVYDKGKEYIVLD